MTDSDTTGMQNELIANLVKSSIEQAQKSHQTYVEISDKIKADTSNSSELAFNEKALDLAKYDRGENLKLALRLNDISDEQDAITTRDEHVRSQSEEMSRRVAELQAMANGQVEPLAAVDPVAEFSGVEVVTAEPAQTPSAASVVAADLVERVATSEHAGF